MKTTRFFLLCCLLFASQLLFAQCPPPGFPQPGNTCPTAPILCENLDGYCATINNNNVVQNYPGCPGWQLNNDEWFAFYAGSTTITVLVTPSNCSNGPMMGLQGAIYAGCGPPWIAMDLQCACTENPFILTANNFVVGQIYWFVLDGCSGNVCDYSIDVLVGSTVGVPPDNPGPVSGPVEACRGTSSGYSISPPTGATAYNWALTPPGLGTVVGNANNATVNWGANAAGTAQLCVTVANQCHPNPIPSCATIEITPIAATVAVTDAQCGLSNGAVNLTPDADSLPYTFIWSNGQTTEDLNNIPAGNYSVTLTNANGCTATLTATVDDNPLTFAFAGNVAANTACVGGNGSIDISESPSGTYTYIWSNGSTTQDLNNLAGGIYEVTVSAGGTCTQTIDFTVPNVPNLPVVSPATTDTICESSTDSLHISISGGAPPYTYLWSNGAVTQNLGNLTPGSYTVTVTGANGCTAAAHPLELLPQPTFSATISFCPGESVTIGEHQYNQPGTVVETVPALSGGCDTIATYTLQYISSPNSSASIACVEDISIGTTPGTGPIAVNYNLPTVASDCDCPGISTVLTAGLPPGSLFPVATTQVCYQAKDSCGNTATCCFNVMVREEQPCDVKTIGCMKWELLSITKDAKNDFTYRIRATNSCTNKLIYTAIQLPDGIVAVKPANNSVFTAESGRKYDVRNPNYSPFYSIRFKSQVDSIANGQSDIFEYVLPGQAPPAYIHVNARLYPQVFYEAHLNTFYCPVGVTPQNRGAGSPPNFKNLESLGRLTVFPNPTDGALFADLLAWQGEQLQVQVFNSQGQRVQHLALTANDAPQEIQLPEQLAGGLYFLEVLSEKGERQTARFVLQH